MLVSRVLHVRKLVCCSRRAFKVGCLNRMDTGTKKMNDRKVIGTHNGSFHCDEVLACAMLRLLPEYKDAVIKRSRDPVVLEACDIVVDVGGVFDPQTHRYDHHQRSFQETFSSLRPEYPWKTKLSSAGLVYVHFGEEVLSCILNMPKDSELVAETYKKIYENFIEEMDAIDNGISTHDGLPRYKITTNLSSRVANYNPWWNQENQVDINARFEEAMELVRTEFVDKVNYFSKCWWPAREKVTQAIENRFNVHESGQIIEFSEGGCPWKEHFFDLEKKLGIDNSEKTIYYALFPDSNGSWRVQAVPVASGSFESRRALPEQWRGVREKELDSLCGIDGCIFVHASGFIGGHRTREGALEMSTKAL